MGTDQGMNFQDNSVTFQAAVQHRAACVFRTDKGAVHFILVMYSVNENTYQNISKSKKAATT